MIAIKRWTFLIAILGVFVALTASEPHGESQKRGEQQQNDEKRRVSSDSLPADEKKVEFSEAVYNEERVVLLNSEGEGQHGRNEREERDETDAEDEEEDEHESHEAPDSDTVVHTEASEPERHDPPTNHDNTRTTAPNVVNEKVLTPEEEKAERLYQEAMKYLSKGRQASNEMNKLAYRLLDESASLSHTKAMELIGYAYLFGDHTRWNVKEARKIFEELSLRGSSKAQLGLAFLHSTGVGMVNSSQSRALVYFTFAALGGSPLAQMALGYRYWAGVNVPTNCERALTWYKKVATKVSEEVKLSGGFAIQRLRLPDEVESQGTSTSSNAIMDQNLLQYYRFLADKGDMQAQVGLGQLYLTGGRGVEQNLEQASHYFSIAAEAGSANAYAYLGKMYLDGSPSTPQDNNTAFQYFKRAADKNNPVGLSGLGIMYMYGKGVQRDYAKALKYFTQAAEQGWVDGQLNLGHMYFNGLGVRRDYKLAIKYFQLASQAGHILAFYNLAQIHATGTGVIRNCHTAVELYKNVAERGKWSDKLMEAYSSYKDGYVDQSALKYLFMAELGYETAQTNFAYMLDRGDSSIFAKTEVLKRALLHWQRSANQGYAIARVKLGDYHYYGWGTPVDYELAANHYKIAAEQQHSAQAMFNLGYMHEQGLGIKKDIHLAKRFYDLAAETSTDAAVPVALAMMKLGLIFAVHFMRDQPWYRMAPFESVFGPDWDLYLMTALISLLVIVVVYRRQRLVIR